MIQPVNHTKILHRKQRCADSNILASSLFVRDSASVRTPQILRPRPHELVDKRTRPHMSVNGMRGIDVK